MTERLETTLQMPAGLSKAVTKNLENLPPFIYGAIALTPDQKALWRQTRHFFKCVGATIDAHSEGSSLPTYDLMSKIERGEVRRLAWRYISFHNMLSFNWEAIRPELAKWSAPAMPLAYSESKAHGIKLEAKIPMIDFADLQTPLGVLLEVMKYQAIGAMHKAFLIEKTEAVPYRERKQIAQLEKARRANAPKALVQQVEKDIRGEWESKPWLILEGHCTGAAEKSKPAKGTPEKQTLTSYLKALQAEEVYIKSRLHKSKKHPRVVWQSGYQLTG